MTFLWSNVDQSGGLNWCHCCGCGYALEEVCGWPITNDCADCEHDCHYACIKENSIKCKKKGQFPCTCMFENMQGTGYRPEGGTSSSVSTVCAKEKRVNKWDVCCIPYSWHEFCHYYGVHAKERWADSRMVVDNEGRLLRVRLMLRAFNCGEIDAERQWCCAHRVQIELEYFVVKIARWSWNDTW